MLTTDSYEDYFNLLSTKMGAATFYPIDMVDFATFEDDMRGNKIKLPAFILEDFSIKGSSANNDQVLDIVQGAIIWLVKKPVKGGDLNANQRIVRNECLTKIQAIKKQCIADRRLPNCIMQWLNVPAYDIDLVKIFSDFTGYRYQFELKIPIE